MRASVAACAALLAVSCIGGGDGPESPRPTSVEPSSGYAAVSVRVVIHGEGFLARPSEEQSGGSAELDARHRVWLDDVELGEVSWIDTRTLQATVPAGLPVWLKRLVVENAFGLRGALDRAFEVTDSPRAALEATLAAPGSVNVGQRATVTLAVQNAGGAAARDVVPDALSLSGAAAAGAVVEGPAPASSASLEPGAVATFTWSVRAATPGTLSLLVRARAVDDLSSVEVSSAAAEASVAVQAPAELTATIVAGRATANVGQAVAVTLTLVNGGAARADVTGVTPRATGPAATCGAVTPAMPQGVAAGASLSLTWTCTASAPGTLSLSADVDGTDGTSGAHLSAAPAVPAQVAVQTPAALSAVLAVEGSPTTVPVGAALTLTLTVEDGGEAGAQVTRVEPVATPTNHAACGAPSPAPPRPLAGLGATTFTWSCTALAAGSFTLGATVAGTDVNTGGTVEATARALALTAQVPAVLVATVAASPSTASVGQAVAVTFTLVNGGSSTADITAVAPAASGTAAAACGAASPATASVSGGKSRAFTWSCIASAPGTLVLTGTATGTDRVSGAPISATPEVPAEVTVQAPAVLAVSSYVSTRSVAVTGQPAVLTLVLANSGEAAADLTAAVPRVSPASSTHCTAAAPAPPQRIAGGASLTLSWSCYATEAGSYALGASLSAVDANSGGRIEPTIAPLPLVVQAPAALAVTAFGAVPLTANVGQAVAVTATVENGGGTPATVNAVTPSITPAATAGCTAASPAPPQSVPAGGSLAFGWTCAASVAGSFALRAAISGTDAETNAPLSAAAGPLALAVQNAASLSAAIAVGGGGPLVIGQPAWVTLTVSNDGDAAANVSAVTPSATGAAATCTAPSPAPPRAVPGGTHTAFTWTCTATNAGDLTLSASVTGTDANTGAALEASAAPGVTRTVISGTALAVSGFRADRSTANVGQPVAVTLTIANTGANGGSVTSIVPTVSPGGAASCTAPSPAPPTAVPGGGSVAFGWTCTVAAAGSYALEAAITATGAGGEPVPLSATPIAVEVRTPALLSVTSLEASPTTADVGQEIAVTLVLANQGEAGANVSSLAPGVSGAGAATCRAPSPAPPLGLPGGASVTFRWTCTGTAAGPVTLEAAVSATDENTGGSVSPPVAGVGVDLQTPAALSGTLSLGSPSVPVDTAVEVTLALENTGQAAAQVISVTPTIEPGHSSCTLPVFTSPQTIEGGTGATFVWACSATEARTFTLGVTVAATDVNTGGAAAVTVPAVELAVTVPPASSPPAPAGEVVLVAVDPLGDGTAEPLIGASGGAVWVGPARDGVTLAWIDPAGTELALPPRDSTVSAPSVAFLGAGGDVLALDAAASAATPTSAGAAAVTTLAAVEGVVYAADARGIARSATAQEGAAGRIDVTPSDPGWRSRESVAVEPPPGAVRWPARDRAVPSIVPFGRCGDGPCVLAARNVAGDAGEPPVAPQLWRCAPSGGPGACLPADWSIAAPDPRAPLTRLGDPRSEALTVLAATPRWLYVGLDAPGGVRLFRAAAVPRSAADLLGRKRCAAGSPGCEGLGGNGFGDRRVTRLLDARVLTVGGVTSLWIVAGDGVGPARIYRVEE